MQITKLLFITWSVVYKWPVRTTNIAAIPQWQVNINNISHEFHLYRGQTHPTRLGQARPTNEPESTKPNIHRMKDLTWNYADTASR